MTINKRYIFSISWYLTYSVTQKVTRLFFFALHALQCEFVRNMFQNIPHKLKSQKKKTITKLHGLNVM